MDEYLDVTFLLKYDNTRLPAGSRPIGLRLGVYSIGFRIRLWSICIIYNYSCTALYLSPYRAVLFEFRIRFIKHR